MGVTDRRRFLLPALLLAAIGAGLAWFATPVATALNLSLSGDPAGPALRTAAVDRGAITAAVSATGVVKPVLTVQVGSQLSGQIRALSADFNTRVSAGQAIARLDTAKLEANRAAAFADLQAAGAQVAVARAAAERAAADARHAAAQREAAAARVGSAEAILRDADYEASRTAELRRSGTGAARDAIRAAFALERMRADLAQSRAQADQAEASIAAAEAAARTALAQVDAAEAARAQKAAVLRQVEVDLTNATIRAPIDGIVILRNVALGQTVAASLQAPVLFEIAANLDEMEIHATVDEADIGRVRPDQEVAFTVAAWPGDNLTGRVKETRLAAETVSNVVTYTVVVSVPNQRGRLLPGMTATLRVITDHRPEALRVPNAALRWRPAGGRGVAQAGASAAGGGGAGLDQALRDLPDLTEGQRTEIEAARAEMRARIAEAGEGPGRQRQIQAERQRMLARINGLLTPEQRARLAEARAGGRGGAPGTVWVLEEGAAAPRAVTLRTGLTDGAFTEVLAGLEEGQAVVTGQDRAPAAAAARGGSGRRLF